MKKFIFFISIFALFIVACDKELDLSPKQSIDAGQAVKDTAGIINVLDGMYGQMLDQDLFAGRFNEYNEVLAINSSAPDMRFIGSYSTIRELNRKQVTVDNVNVRDTWLESYAIINSANIVLSSLDKFKSTSVKSRVKGEALLVRGWLVFELTRLYGHTYNPGATNSQPGIPIITKPTYVAADAALVARSTVEECFNQAIDDLKNAKTLLSALGKNGTRVNTYAAAAILARVYLQMGKFNDAAREADYVIQSGSFSLTATPLKEFNNSSNTTEDIFAIQQNKVANDSWLGVMYASLNDAGRGDYEIQQSFLNKFEDGDLRGQLDENTNSSYTYVNLTTMYYIGVGNINNNGGINTSKWANYYTNIPLIRLAEMYLVRAEGNFMAGTSVGATVADDINTIRQRAGLAGLSTITLNIIKDERYKELCWEGFRLQDLKRWKQNIGSVAYNANNIVLPIPLRERKANPNLVQNPGYAE